MGKNIYVYSKNERWLSVMWDLRCWLKKKKRLKTRSILFCRWVRWSWDKLRNCSSGPQALIMNKYWGLHCSGLFQKPLLKKLNKQNNELSLLQAQDHQRPLSNYKWRAAVFSATWQKGNRNWFKGNSNFKTALASQ